MIFFHQFIFVSKRNLKILFIYFLITIGLEKVGFSQEIIPYLQSPTDTTIWISWKTGSGTETIVKLGTDSLLLDQTYTGSYQKLEDPAYTGNYYYHSVQLTGLQPSTFYYYKAITNGLESKIYRFKTQPVNGSINGHFRFLIFGDHQIPDREGYGRLMVAAKAKVTEKYGGSIEENINLIMNDGDQVDEGNLFQYEKVHFEKSKALSPNLPIMTAVGNHETYGSLGLEAYYPHFFYDNLRYKGIVSPGGENYYSFQTGRIVYAVLSSEHTNNEQVEWIQEVMDSVKVDNDVDWLISIAHRPIQAEQYIDDISLYIKNQIVPILTQSPKSVMLITGHHHLYARGQQRDFPMFHIISGAASWDQFWGQSVEKDFDNVQKTIDFWAYQIVNIDLEKQNMQVESYAIGSPKLGFTMDNVLIDSFHRTFGKSVPIKPTIITEVPDTIQLPFTFESSEYQTNSGEEFNSTQFQVSSTEEFVNPEIDIIRDFENLYGTSGEPDYLPVDINKGTNLFEFEIKQFRLPNGRYFIRVRHRDKNVEWSEWSDKKSFVVTESTEGIPEVSTLKKYYDLNESIDVLFKNGPANPKDWIGIYKKGHIPGGGNSSTDWEYVNSSSGSVTLQVEESGEYFAVLFSNDGYTEITERVWIYVTSIPVTTTGKPGYNENELIMVNFSNAPAFDKDWIGIYKLNDVPGMIGSTDWKYVSGQNGSVTFNSLPRGYYYANYFLLNEYDEPGNRVYFTIGDNLANISLNKENYSPAEDIIISLNNGPGLQNDWIGIFKDDNEIPVDSVFVPGAKSGEFTYSGLSDSASYYVSLFMNGTDDEISNRVYFSVKPNAVSAGYFLTDKTITIYPSPTEGLLHIDFNNFRENIKTISIFTLPGKLVFFQNFKNNPLKKSETIDFSGNKKGIYLISVTTNTSTITRKVFLK